MARRPAGGDEVLQMALQQVQQAQDADALRAAQAVLLPLLGLSLNQTASAVGRDRFWVSRARNRLIRGQPPPGPHGGRRHAHLLEDAEVELVKAAIRLYRQTPWLPDRRFATLRAAVRHLADEAADQPMSEAAITALLDRTAPRIVEGATGAMLEPLSFHLSDQWFRQEYVASFVARAR